MTPSNHAFFSALIALLLLPACGQRTVDELSTYDSDEDAVDAAVNDGDDEPRPPAEASDAGARAAPGAGVLPACEDPQDDLTRQICELIEGFGSTAGGVPEREAGAQDNPFGIDCTQQDPLTQLLCGLLEGTGGPAGRGFPGGGTRSGNDVFPGFPGMSRSP